IKPGWALLEPGVIRRTLNREIHGDFQVMLLGRAYQLSKIVKRPQLRMNGLVPAFGRTNGIRTSRLVWASFDSVVLALAVGLPDRVDGRKVQHIESHIPYERQAV